jgi:hypothetical protein
MNQAWMRTPFFDDALDPLFLAKRFVVANEFYLKPVFFCQPWRVLPDGIP